MLPENYIIDKIEQLCKKKDMTRYRLAVKAGVAQSSISTLMNRKSIPTVPTLDKLCDGFEITLSQFFADDGERMTLTVEQERVLDVWDGLSEMQKELVKAYIEGMKSK